MTQPHIWLAEVDLSAFERARKRPPGCGLAALRLTDQQRAALEAACERSGEYTVEGITKVIRDWGYPIGKDTVRTHRRRECACGRPK